MTDKFRNFFFGVLREATKKSYFGGPFTKRGEGGLATKNFFLKL